MVNDDKECQVQQTKLATINIDKTEKANAEAKIKEIKKSYTEQFLGFLHLENSDRSRHGSLLSGLETQFSLSFDQCPKTLIDAQNVIENHSYNPECRQRRKQCEELRQ